MLQELIMSRLSPEDAFDGMCRLASSLLALAVGGEALLSSFDPDVLKTCGAGRASMPTPADPSTAERSTYRRDDSLPDQAIVYFAKALVDDMTALTSPGAIPALAVLYDRLSADSDRTPSSTVLALAILESFRLITEISVQSRVKMSRSGIMSITMRRLVEGCATEQEHEALMLLCAGLLTDGIDLEDAAYLLKHASTHDAARLLLQKAAEQEKQPPCIHFDLSTYGYSALEFQTLPRSFPPPPSSGYTWTAWVKFDNLSAHTHTTLFGLADATNTCFVLIYVEAETRQIILQTSTNAPNPSKRFKKARFEEGQWYHIALVQRGSRIGHHSDASLFVNGRHVERKDGCLYPQPPPLVTTNTSPFPAEPGSRQPVGVFFGTPQRFAQDPAQSQDIPRWCLASAHLYDVCLSHDLLAVYHALGPSYSGNHQDHMGPWLTYRAAAEIHRYNEEVYYEKVYESEITSALGKPGSQILHEASNLISVSATSKTGLDGFMGDALHLESVLPRKAAQQLQVLARSGNVLLFNAATPRLSEALRRPYGAGLLTGKAFASITHSMDDACWQIGGFVGVQMKIVESATTPESLLAALRTLFACVQSNWRTSEVMEKSNGYGVVALLLREKLVLYHSSLLHTLGRQPLFTKNCQERETLIHELLKTILEFLGLDLERPQKSLMLNPMAYRSLLLDNELWRNVTIASQGLYYQQFHWLLQGNDNPHFNIKRLSRVRAVRALLNSFKSDDIYHDNLPYALQAFEDVFTHLTSKGEHRDLANFIAYAMQEARAERSTRRHRRSTLRNIVPGRSSPPHVGSLRRAMSQLGQPSTPKLSTHELGISVLERFATLFCDGQHPTHLRRFVRSVPTRWLLHMLAETEPRVVSAAMKMIARALIVQGTDFKIKFTEKMAGFQTVKARLRSQWENSSVWVSCFAILFGQDIANIEPPSSLTLYYLVSTFAQGAIKIENPEVMPAIIGMLEAA